MDKEFDKYIISHSLELLERFENIVIEKNKQVEHSCDQEYIDFVKKNNNLLLSELKLTKEGLEDILKRLKNENVEDTR